MIMFCGFPVSVSAEPMFERHQVWKGIQPPGIADGQNQRRHHDADRVVHEQGRQDGRRDGNGHQKCEGGPHHPETPRQPLEQARITQVLGDDHHAEQQADRIPVHLLIRLFGGHHAEKHHENSAQKGSGRSADRQKPHLAERDEDEGESEDDASGPGVPQGLGNVNGGRCHETE